MPPFHRLQAVALQAEDRVSPRFLRRASSSCVWTAARRIPPPATVYGLKPCFYLALSGDRRASIALATGYEGWLTFGLVASSRQISVARRYRRAQRGVRAYEADYEAELLPGWPPVCGRTMQRKPMWQVEVSTISGERAAGR